MHAIDEKPKGRGQRRSGPPPKPGSTKGCCDDIGDFSKWRETARKLKCVWSCDVNCCGGAEGVRCYVSSACGWAITLCACVFCYATLLETQCPPPTALRKSTLNVYGARVSVLSHADAYSPALWARAVGCVPRRPSPSVCVL